MRQFIPFEDDWDALENLRPEDLIPYRVGLLDDPDTGAGRAVSDVAAAFGVSSAHVSQPLAGSRSGS
jgi:hypothetical protein